MAWLTGNSWQLTGSRLANAFEPVNRFLTITYEFSLVAAITLLTLSGLLWSGQVMNYWHENFARPWDHHKYIEMSENGVFAFHIAPYGRRVGMPFVASLMPFELATNFFIISFVSTWLVAILIYYIARQTGFNAPMALTGALLWYTVDWAARFYLFDFWLVDPLAELFIVAAIYAILSRRDLLFVVLLTLGVTVKESVVFVAPLYYSLNAPRWVDRRLALKTILLAIPAGALLIGIRLLIPAWNNDPSYIASLPERLWLVQFGSSQYGLLWYLREIAPERSRYLSVQALMFFTVRPFGIIVAMMPFFAFRKNLYLFLRYSPFIVLVYIQHIFGDGYERYFVVAAPVVVLLALNGIEAIQRQFNVRAEAMLIIPVALLTVVLVRQYRIFTPLETQAIVLLAALAIIFQLRSVFPAPES